MAKETIPVVLVRYELQLPADRAGERVAKTLSRVLKRTFAARAVRIELRDGVRVVSGTVEKRMLESIRSAAQLVMGARQMHGGIIRDHKTARPFENLPAMPRRSELASSEQSGAEGDGDSGAPSGAVVQAQPEPVADEPPAVA